MNFQDQVKAFKALSDATRLRILALLMERECCVCEIMQALEISQTRASRNLAQLYNAGFLILRREGLWSLYSIDTAKIEPFLAGVLKAAAGAIESDPVVVRDRQNLQSAQRIGPTACCQPIKKNG